MLKSKVVLSVWLLLISMMAVAQSKTVTGKVSSADNVPQGMMAAFL
jgi:hypothetical protein